MHIFRHKLKVQRQKNPHPWRGGRKMSDSQVLLKFINAFKRAKTQRFFLDKSDFFPNLQGGGVRRLVQIPNFGQRITLRAPLKAVIFWIFSNIRKYYYPTTQICNYYLCYYCCLRQYNYWKYESVIGTRWVIRPERPKDAECRVKNPKGPPARPQGSKSPDHWSAMRQKIFPYPTMRTLLVTALRFQGEGWIKNLVPTCDCWSSTQF